MRKVPHMSKEKRHQVLHQFAVIYLAVCCCQGIIVLGVSSWMASQRNVDCKFMSPYYIEVFMMVTASVLLVLATGGGYILTLQGNQTELVRKFIILLVIIVVLEILASLSAGVHLYWLNNVVFKATMNASLTGYYTNSDETICWELLQRNQKCCGVTNYSDWSRHGNRTFAPALNYTIPTSCNCLAGSHPKKGRGSRGGGHDDDEDNEANCIEVKSSNNSTLTIYSEGCNSVLSSELEGTLTTILIVGIVFSLFQVLITTVIFYLASRVENSSVIEAYVVNEDSNIRNPSLNNLAKSTSSRASTPALNSSVNNGVRWARMGENKQNTAEYEAANIIAVVAQCETITPNSDTTS